MVQNYEKIAKEEHRDADIPEDVTFIIDDLAEQAITEERKAELRKILQRTMALVTEKPKTVSA